MTITPKTLSSVPAVGEYQAGDTLLIIRNGLYTRLNELPQGLQGEPGPPGENGSPAVFRREGGFLQWKLAQETTWQNLVPLADISGEDGRSIELRTTETHIQYRVVGDQDWINLIALSLLEGPQGQQGLQGPPGEPGAAGGNVIPQEVSGSQSLSQWRFGDFITADTTNITTQNMPNDEAVNATFYCYYPNLSLILWPFVGSNEINLVYWDDSNGNATLYHDQFNGIQVFFENLSSPFWVKLMKTEDSSDLYCYSSVPGQVIT